MVSKIVVLSLAASSATALTVVEPAALRTRPDFLEVADASGHESHEVTFAIKQLNIDVLHKTLMEVSEPKSTKRGQYLSHDEVNAITANPEAVKAVETFLIENKVSYKKVDKFGNYIKAQTTVSKWEQLFKTDIRYVASVEDQSKPFLRAISDAHLPDELAKHVDGLFRLTSLPPTMRPLPLISNRTANADPVTPSGIKSFYNVQGSGSSAQSQCVFESLGQYGSASDLSKFETQFNLPSVEIAQDIGGHESDIQCVHNANNCAEANLDVQYMIAMAPDTPLTYWYDSNQNTPFEDWIEAVEASSNPPLVNSISYGGIEESFPASVTSAFDTAAMKLGTQGVTVFVSSGDDGVTNFQARSDKSKCGYHPSYPATSPYVTAVGATQGGINGGAEIACSSDTGGQITTGGGFSTKYSMPSYQKDVVDAYLSSSAGKSAASGYDASGRAYPDVAMAGYDYEVVIAGKLYGVSGTSASSPVVAGFASLVNAKRAANGASSVGFINPTLYAAGSSSFNDITSGNNKCCAGGEVCCTQGFTATSGWDPLTGLGSVDYAKFEALFASESVVV